MRIQSLPLLVLSLGLAACPAAGSGTDSDTDATGGTTDADTGTDTDVETPTTGEPAEDLNPHTLGDHASQGCVDAMAEVGAFLAATAAGDAAAASAAYTDPLKIYVQTLDNANMRGDDAAIAAALGQGDAAGAATAEGALLTGLARQLRNSLSATETGAEDQYATWDEAYCVWDGALRTLAARAEMAAPGDPIAADIDAAFAAGHDGISGDPPATAVDDWRIPPNKQIVEKTLFRAAHLDVVYQAYVAAMGSDPVAAARSLAEFDIIRDRLEGRNTPGIAQIEAMLSGDPAMIDGTFIAIELDIAFAKRTRNYADQAFGEGLGIPSSYKGAVEGRTYAKLIVAGMKASMLDTDGYLADWDAYVEHVRTGADMAAATAVSQKLIDATCAYQTVLGIAECTGSEDEAG